MTLRKPPDDLTDNLGLAQQCWHMANAACEAMRLPFEDTSPSEIYEKIVELVSFRDQPICHAAPDLLAALVAIRDYARDSRTGRMLTGEGYAMADAAITKATT